MLGSSADEADEILRRDKVSVERVHTVRAAGWQAGLGASLKAELDALDSSGATAALLHLLDLPDVGATVVRRVLASVARWYRNDGR